MGTDIASIDMLGLHLPPVKRSRIAGPVHPQDNPGAMLGHDYLDDALTCFIGIEPDSGQGIQMQRVSIPGCIRAFYAIFDLGKLHSFHDLRTCLWGLNLISVV